MKKILALLLISVMMFSLTACDNTKDDNKSTEKNESKKLEKVKIALDWSPNSNHAGIYVAIDKGYFKEEGVEVELVDASETGAEVIVASNACNFGISFQDMLATSFAKEESLPVTAVAAIIQHNTSGIVSLKEKGIDSPEKLEGHKYATWEWDIEQAIIKKVVEEKGGDYSKIEMVPTYVDNIVAGLNSGIDAVWIYRGWDGAILDTQKIEYNFIRFSDYAKELDYYSPVLIANNDYLSANKETTKKLLNALKKGYEYTIENPEEAAKLMAKQVEELDEEVLKSALTYLSKEYKAEESRWGYIDKERWDRFYSWLFENEMLEKEIESGQGFTNEFLPEK